MDTAADLPLPAAAPQAADVASARRRHRLPALRSRATVLVVAVLALVASASAVSYAAGRATTAVINACYKTTVPHTLTVRDGATCPSGTTALSWNKRGPRGLQGIQGIQGVPGAPGMSGFGTSSGVTGTIPAGNIGAIDVPCPDGELAVSGGYAVPYGATVLESHVSSSNPSVWTVVAAFPAVSGTITASAQCAQVATAAAAAKASGKRSVTVSVRPITP